MNKQIMAKKPIIDKSLFQEIADPSERIKNLTANASGKETLNYMKQFDNDELISMKDELSDTSIMINDIEIEKKEATTAYADSLKPLKIERKRLLLNLKQKSEMVTESCFKYLNEDARMACFYNSEGDLVSSRPMTQDEMQKAIVFEQRTAM